MLKIANKQIVISGASTFKNQDGVAEPAISFYSSVQTGGAPCFNQGVNNMQMYEEHMEECDADFAEFKKTAIETMKEFMSSQ